MKKLFLVVLVLLSVFLGYSFARDNLLQDNQAEQKSKTEILRFALVADSHDENELLAKALADAKARSAVFVMGMGDYTEIGTIEQLTAAKRTFDASGAPYFVTAGDHDLWDSRNRGEQPLANFNSVFGKSTQVFDRQGVQFVILDNSDIYTGISSESWNLLNQSLSDKPVVNSKSDENSKSETRNPKLTFVFAHKTPFHPQSGHVMGEDSARVLRQAKELMDAMEKSNVDGFFSGDLHFFAQFNSPNEAVKITTVGAVNSARNFQGPRFAIVKVFDDYSWEVEDVEV